MELSRLRVITGMVTALLVSLVSGCTGLDQLTSLTAGDQAEGGEAVEGSPETAADAATGLPAGLDAIELELLTKALAGLTGGGTGGALNDIPGTSADGGLKGLGLSKREVAIWALDLAVQRAPLTPQQEFGLKLARAYLSRDEKAMQQLVLDQVSGLLGGSSTGTGD